MIINNIVQTSSIYQMQNKTSNTPEASQSNATTDTVNISKAGLNAANKWQQIANDYDVTNISQNETAGMVTELLDNGLISSTDGIFLLAPASMNVDPEFKRDMLSDFRESLAFAKANGGSAEYIKNMESAIEVLDTLFNLSNKTKDDLVSFSSEPNFI